MKNGYGSNNKKWELHGISDSVNIQKKLFEGGRGLNTF